MALAMKEKVKIISDMEAVLINGQVGHVMKENGRRDICVVRDNFIGMMENFM